MIRRLRDQGGFSLPELLVTLLSGMVIFSAIMVMTTTGLRNQDRISRRVDASSRVRPVLTHITNELHSACVAQHVAPIIATQTSGKDSSSGTQLSFISKSGNSVTPTPDQHVITLSGGTLSEAVYPALGGAQPGPWSFSSTASSNQQLLTHVSAPVTGLFQYYDFVNGALDTTPSAVPLSAFDAARTAIVKITLTSAPGLGNRNVSNLDPNSPLLVTNSVDLRLENAGQYPNQENLPCV